MHLLVAIYRSVETTNSTLPSTPRSARMPRRNGETTTDSPRHLVPAFANPVAPAVPALSLAELGPLHGPWLLHGVEGCCP